MDNLPWHIETFEFMLLEYAANYRSLAYRYEVQGSTQICEYYSVLPYLANTTADDAFIDTKRYLRWLTGRMYDGADAVLDLLTKRTAPIRKLILQDEYLTGTMFDTLRERKFLPAVEEFIMTRVPRYVIDLSTVFFQHTTTLRVVLLQGAFLWEQILQTLSTIPCVGTLAEFTCYDGKTRRETPNSPADLSVLRLFPNVRVYAIESWYRCSGYGDTVEFDSALMQWAAVAAACEERAVRCHFLPSLYTIPPGASAGRPTEPWNALGTLVINESTVHMAASLPPRLWSTVAIVGSADDGYVSSVISILRRQQSTFAIEFAGGLQHVPWIIGKLIAASLNVGLLKAEGVEGADLLPFFQQHQSKEVWPRLRGIECQDFSLISGTLLLNWECDDAQSLALLRHLTWHIHTVVIVNTMHPCKDFLPHRAAAMLLRDPLLSQISSVEVKIKPQYC